MFDVKMAFEGVCLVLVQPRKTRPCLTEILLMERKESNQNKKGSDNSYSIR